MPGIKTFNVISKTTTSITTGTSYWYQKLTPSIRQARYRKFRCDTQHYFVQQMHYEAAGLLQLRTAVVQQADNPVLHIARSTRSRSTCPTRSLRRWTSTFFFQLEAEHLFSIVYIPGLYWISCYCCTWYHIVVVYYYGGPYQIESTVDTKTYVFRFFYW